MSLYECVFIARPDLSTAQVEGLANHFASVIQQGGGKVKKIEHCGLRTLAYRIRKNKKAYYVLMNLDTPAAALHEMERQMRLNEDVMRHLTIAVEKHEDGPSILSFKRSSEAASETQNARPSRDGQHRDGGYRKHVAHQGDSEDNSEANVAEQA